MRPAQPTLLIFTLGPGAEGARRRLLLGRLRTAERALHRACLDAALEAGRGADCRIEVSSPRALELPAGVSGVPQRGRGFGGRLAAAVRRASHPGQPLLLVGTDVPGLEARHLRQALARLEGSPLERTQRRVVLGPSPDGGFYLLAASEPVEHLFAEIPWCRHDTLTQLHRVLLAAGFEVEFLEPLADLDRAADLARLLRKPSRLAQSWRALLDHLRDLLAALRAPAAPSRLGRPQPAAVPVRAGRAPPVSRSRR